MDSLEAAAGEVQPGDLVQFAVGMGNQVMTGEGYVMAVEPRGPNPTGNFLFVAVLGVPSTMTLPAVVCRVLERGALIRRVQLR